VASSVRVLLIDDYADFRALIRSVLQKHLDFSVISEASDGLQAVQKAGELQPDLILLDADLPYLHGIEVARRITQLAPKAKILFLSVNRSPDVAIEALLAGASGYVVKTQIAKELLPAIEAVLQGRQFISAILTGHCAPDPRSERCRTCCGARKRFNACSSRHRAPQPSDRGES
jgi:DNA-binding NarL/FixJ family response regulator